MAQELDNKPGSEYDDDWKPAAYNGDAQDVPAGDASDPRGEYDPQTSPAGDSSDPRGDIKQAEENGSNESTTKDALENEAARLSDRLGKGYTGQDNGKQGRGKSLIKNLAKKQAAILLVPIAIIAAVILVFSILSGPAQFVHFAQLLHKFHFVTDQTLMGHRGGLLIKYAHTADNPIERNMSHFGNQFADYYERKLLVVGIEPQYEQRRIRYLKIDPDTAEGRKALDYMRSKGVDINSMKPEADGKIKIDIDSSDKSTTRFRRQVLGGMVDTLGFGVAHSAIASRILRVRANVEFRPLTNLVRDKDEDLRQYRDRVKKERAERIRTGANTTPRKGSAGQTTDANGNPTTNAEDLNAVNEGNEITDIASNPDEPVSVRSEKIKGNLTKGVGATGYLATICAIKAIGDASSDVRQANIVLPLIRTGMDVKATGSQVQSGIGFNSDELGAISENLYDKKTETSWSSARSIQAELGQEQTGPDMPDAAKPGQAKPGFFKKIDSVIGVVPGGNTFCGAVNSTVGGWVLTGVGVGLTATGPINALLSVGSESAQYLLAGAFIDDLVRWLSGEQIATDASGALLGNYANYGARLAANEKSISHGGSELTAEEEIVLNNERNTIERMQNQNSTFYARYFDINNVNSLLAKAMFESPAASSDINNVATIIQLPVKFVSSMVSSVNFLMPKAGASNHYDYGFPEFGFTLNEIDDRDYENPIRNSKIVEPRLEELNKKYGEPCFGTTVDPITYKLNAGKSGGIPYDKIPDECKDRSNVELTRYRFYLVDQVVAKSMACWELDDGEACEEVGAVSEIAGENGENSAITGEGGEKIAAVAEREYAKNGNKPIESCGQNCGPEVQKYTGGPSGPGAPWCAWFVSWVYREAGYEFKGAPAGADGNIPAVINLIAWFKQHGIHYTPSSTRYKPQPGDVVMYGGDQHTGIVVKVSGDNIETIEGNTSGDGSFNAEGGTVGRKSYNYKTYNTRSIEFGRLKSF